MVATLSSSASGRINGRINGTGLIIVYCRQGGTGKGEEGKNSDILFCQAKNTHSFFPFLPFPFFPSYTDRFTSSAVQLLPSELTGIETY